jgi:hypothetical protein
MGYNSQDNTINVKVEKLIRPDLTREENVEITYETVDERTFSKSDFPQNKDNMAWQVDFDVKTEKIVEPFDVYAYTSTIASGSLFHRVMWRKIKERYSSETLLPLFTVDSFYKDAEGFSLSTLQFHVADLEGTVADTIITNPDVEEMTQAEKIAFVTIILSTSVFYEVYDENDNLISSILNSSPNPQQALSARGGPGHTKGGNQYRASVPNAGTYKVKLIFIRSLENKTISNQFDVSCINAIANKSRVISGVKAGQEIIETEAKGVDGLTKFAGSENIRLTASLDSGDYIKLKLSVGDFYSYSELWLDII